MTDSKGEQYAREIKKRERERTRHALQTKHRRREIQENPELTPEQKRGQLDRLRQEALAKYHKLNREIEKFQKLGDEATKRERAARSVDGDAVTRVNDLLRDGVAADLIIERALEIGDAETVAALRTQAHWFKGKGGFLNANDTIRACDRALAKIGRGNEADVNYGLVEFEEAKETLAITDRFAGKAVLGQDTPMDTLALAYATGAGRVDDGD